MPDISDRLQGLRPSTQALQWVHFSTLLSTLIQAMKKKAAVFTALGHMTCRHPTTFKTGVIQTTDKHARQDKTSACKIACEPGFVVMTKASASSSACWLAPPVAWQSPGHPVFL